MKFIALLMALVLVIAMLPSTFAVGVKPIWTTESVKSIREKFTEQSTFREQIKQQIQDCKDREDEECMAIKEAAQQLTKNILLRVCSRSEDIFERFEDRIEKDPKLTEEEKDVLKESLQNQKDQLEEICEDIEDADEERLKEIVAEIRALIKGTHLKFRIARKLVLLHRMGLIIERAEHLETKLDDFIEKWNCTNTTNIDPLVEQFNSQIAEARESYNESRDLWGQFIETVQNHEPDTEILREAQSKMQEAQSKLKEAHKTLKEIIQELRKCREASGEEEEPEEEPEEEEEEEPEE
ncbi:MAG: hypothetical protein IB618_00930 [Candidatus Pacearchaeota archaeon]|nr:MAG: hypothetical protein IB618_00930 [Candidatus Pacearchaeota archaeon]